MMYSEFVEGTGCKDNDYNYKVFKNLEVMYMNSDMSKAEIYEYGKKLVDNSKSQEQLELEAKINAEIDELKYLINMRKDDIARYERYLNECDNTENEVKWMKDSIKTYKGNIKHYRNRIAELKWVLA